MVKKMRPDGPYLVHAGHGLVQGKARVAQVAGLEHVEPLEHGVHHGVVHRDLDVGIVLAQQLQRDARGLIGVRELFGYADADGLLARLGHLAEDLEEVLGRGRGALRVHARDATPSTRKTPPCRYPRPA